MVQNTLWMFQNSFNHFPYWKFRLFMLFLFSSLHLYLVTSLGEILDNCNQFPTLMVVPDICTQIPNIFDLGNLLVKNCI